MALAWASMVHRVSVFALCNREEAESTNPKRIGAQWVGANATCIIDT